VITLLVLASMLHLDPLPRTTLQMLLAAPAPPPAAVPAAPRSAEAPATHAPVLYEFNGKTLLLPTRVPDKVAVLDDGPALNTSTGGPTADGVPGGMPAEAGEFLQRLVPAIPKPPAEVQRAVQKPTEIQRLRVGGQVQEALRIYAPKPTYPQLAVRARITGLVRLSAVIARDGTVQSLTVVSGHPLLAPAAMEAVRQWRYRPTKLNGEPVEVVTTIDVNFTLGS
jgi:protein TonB